jgi:hypothetical protein
MKIKFELDWICATGAGLFLGAVGQIDLFNEDGHGVNHAIGDHCGPWEDAPTVLAQMRSMGDKAANVCGFVHENCCVVGVSYEGVMIVLRSPPLQDTKPITVSKCFTVTYKRIIKTLERGLQ